MKQGDDAFNDHDFAVLNAVHHPDMVAYVPGNADPIYGSAAHAAMVQQISASSPTSASTTTRTRSSSEAATGSPWSPAPPEPSPGKWPGLTAP